MGLGTLNATLLHSRIKDNILFKKHHSFKGLPMIADAVFT
ncbi:hypothetical protein D3OALGA1CA_4443 [Olavius algarvensis associated proteobacterium Delta 3]|nr:hypothetical protein D3OALGA1CA_4443 [Olavius algarvensis associated proteobacterium Delta 3]